MVIVGMADSIHVARWLEQLRGEAWDIRLVSSSPHRRIHPRVQSLLEGQPGQALNLSIGFVSRKLSAPLWVLDRFLNDRLRGALLRREVQKHDPKIVHVLEFQHAGYMLLASRVANKTSSRPRCIVTNYGSDIYWFQNQRRHLVKIKQLLQVADAYTAECNRDLLLAVSFGLRSEIVEVFPNTGGLTREDLGLSKRASVTSKRKLLVVKGYEGKFGMGIAALKLVSETTRKFPMVEVIVYSANLRVRTLCLLLKVFRGTNVRAYSKGSLSHSSLLELLRDARVYFALSRSDGISTSMLEAMAMGAFPIQSGTACADEWLVTGQSGFIVDINDLHGIDEQLANALENDRLVESAQKLNLARIESSYTTEVVGMKIRSFYERVVLSAGEKL